MAVYLIWWPPKCGKTTLSKKLAQELSIPFISADTLQSVIYPYIDASHRKKLFPNQQLRGETNDEKYEQYSSEEIIEAYIKQGKTSYKAISMMAEVSLIEEQDYIIEWYQVTPDIVSQIIKKFGKEHIYAIFLFKTDVEKFIYNIHKSTTPNDWIIRRTEKESTYTKIAEMICKYSHYFKSESEKYGLKAIKMDQEFENQLKKAISHLTTPPPTPTQS